MNETRHLHNILIIGEVTKEPQTIALKTGSSCCKFDITCTHKYKKRSGEDETKTQKYNILTYSKTACEIIMQSVTVGATVAVNGEHNCVKREYQGKVYYVNEVVVPSATFGGFVRILGNVNETIGVGGSSNDCEYDDVVPF